jgi:hypothetical protein
LFGQEYDEKRFDRTLHAANLEDDIKVLPGGVLTEIGEKRSVNTTPAPALIHTQVGEAELNKTVINIFSALLLLCNHTL